MRHDRKAIERWILGQLWMGDATHPPAFGQQNAIDRTYLLEKANRFFFPVSVELQKNWKPIPDKFFRDVYAKSESGICCSEFGLFLPITHEDVLATEEYLLVKIRGTGRRITRIRRAHPNLGPYRNQLDLPGLNDPIDEEDTQEIETE